MTKTIYTRAVLNTLTACLTIAALSTMSGCLKTRAQIRGENDGEQSAESPAKVASYQMDEFKAELTRLNGRIEELEHKQQGANTSVLWENVAKLEAQTKEMEQTQVLVMSELKALKDKATEEKVVQTERAAVKAKPKDAIANAYKLLEQKKFADAQSAFGTITASGLRGKDASYAHFGMGRALYGVKDYKKAIVSFSKVQESYPKSDKVPASLYWIARSFDQLGMKKEADGFYQELVDKHPQSPEAKKVKAAPKKAGQ